MSEFKGEAIEEISCLKALIKEYGGVDSYTTTQAATIFEQLCRIYNKLGLDVGCRADFFKGICHIFNIELVNMGNYEQGRYVFAPNHVSEFDGVIYGTIIPNMLVVAKSDWISNPHLNSFTEKLFPIVSLIRKDGSSGMNVLRKCVAHLKKTQDSAVTIFVQQTIVDIDITTPEDIASGAYYIAQKASAKVIPVYSEQVSAESPTRIVFGEPIECADKEDFGKAWLERELAMRDSITSPAARPPMLCEKHRKPISERVF